jgi:lambda repressor-like predicted transcriptional regulator
LATISAATVIRPEKKEKKSTDQEVDSTPETIWAERFAESVSVEGETVQPEALRNRAHQGFSAI